MTAPERGRDAAALDAVLETLLEHYRVYAPVRATAMGDDAADAALDDWGASALDARLRDLGRVERSLARVAPEGRGADPDDVADAALIADEVAALRYELEQAEVHRRDPRLYVEGVVAGIGELVRREPPDATAVAARLREVPRLLAQARANLDGVVAEHREAALADVARAETVLERAAPSADEEARAARAELRAWAHWLESVPAGGHWRAGEQGWRAAARALLGVDVGPERLWAWADAQLSESAGEVAALAGEVVRAAETPTTTDERPPPPDPPHGDGLIDEALAALSRDRPPREEWLAVAAGIVVEVAARVTASGLFPPAPAHPLRLQPVAAGAGGLARLRPPAPLRADDPAILEVAVPGDDAGNHHAGDDTARADGGAGWSTPPGLLGGGDVHALRAAALHEVHPGHHLHVAHVQAHPRRVRRVLRSAASLEGWALHAERAAVAAGEWDARPRLARAVMERWAAAEALGDIALHVRGWEPSAAEQLLVERGHLDRPRARHAVARIQRDPARRSVYAVGVREVARLHATWRLGDAAFHAAVLDAGAPPPRALPALLERSGGRRGRSG